jgi:hypothetical protein
MQYDLGPSALLPLWKKAAADFCRPYNPSLSAGLEAANLGSGGMHDNYYITTSDDLSIRWKVKIQKPFIMFSCRL